MSKIIEICGLVLGMALPLAGILQYALKNQRHSRKTLVYSISVCTLAVGLVGTEILISIAEYNSSNTFFDPVEALIGFVAVLIGVISFVYQRRFVRRSAQSNPQLEHKQISADERIKDYLAKLRTDPHIANIQILDMGTPISVKGLYVQMRLFKLSPSIVNAKKESI